DAVAHRNGGVAHDVEALLGLEDLVEARIGGLKELDLAAALARRAALVGEMHFEALARRGGEFPVLLHHGALAGAVGNRALHAMRGRHLVTPERAGRSLGSGGV